MRNTQYKIGVLTNSTGPSMDDLTLVAQEHAVVFEPINFNAVSMVDFAHSELLTACRQYDVIYYRTLLRDTIIYRLADILTAEGIPVVNAGSKHHRLHRKTQQALIADQYNIPQPRSCLMFTDEYERVVSLIGKPFVAKTDYGSKGNGVTLVRTREEFEALRAQQSSANPLLFQEFIEGADEYRVYTAGEKGIAVYKKISHENDFRANLHLGGSMEVAEPERIPALLAFGGQVASLFGADLSGVDVLYKNNQCLFLELNWQPGWEQLDELTGKNYASITIQYLLDQAHVAKTQR